MKIVPILILVGLIVAGVIFSSYKPQPLVLKTTTVYQITKLLPEFTLTDQHAQTFTVKQLKGRWSVIFFGFTNCPDVCPTTMAALTQIAEKLPTDLLKRVQFILVSTDPERDTIERLAEYIASYHQDFIAVTGDDSEIQKLSKSLSAVYIKVPSEDSYTMMHSGTLFIVNPQGEQYGIFSKSMDGGIDVEMVATDLKNIILSQ